jgi:Flp pilus assembly protein TadG
MTMNRLIATLRDACRRFAGAKDGNTVITFALAFIPLMGLIGAAVDYSRAFQLQTSMQAAADATALMVAQSAASETNTAVQTATDAFYRGMFTNTAAQGLQVAGTYSNVGGSTVYVRATATYRTSFMGVMGFRTLPLAAASTASFGNSRLRVALVLDNTGSMQDNGKIDALITATNNLLNQLNTAATNNGDVYVSIIPFVKDVNVGGGYYNANWIYWDDSAHSDTKSWDANNGSCSVGNYSPRSSCVSHTGCSISGYNSQSSCTSAGSCSVSDSDSPPTQNGCGVCSNSSHHHQSSCSGGSNGHWTPGVWTTGVWAQGTWTPDDHNTWNGCVMDRGNANAPSSGNYDTNVALPTTADTGSQYPAEQYSPCPQAVMGLSYDWTDMHTLVNAMSPGGNTNQAIGLQLGWMSLVGGGPFTMPAEDANYTYQHVIILLTDGLNTQDRWYTSQGSIDARQTLTCTNIRNAGITLYTIQVNTGGDPTSTLLQNCATDSSKFFLLTSASQIVTTFNQIGTNLSKLHIAR